MFLPTSIYESLLGKFKESSVRTYDTQIRRIFTNAFDSAPFDFKCLEDFDKVHKYLDSLDKVSIKKSLTQAVINVFKVVDINNTALPKYQALFKDYAFTHTDTYLYKMPTQNEMDNVVTFADVRDKFTHYKSLVAKDMKSAKTSTTSNTSKSKKNNANAIDKHLYLRYVVLGLYTYIPPLRGQDYYNTRIITNNDIINLTKEIDNDNDNDKDNDKDKIIYAALLKKLKSNFLHIDNMNLVIGDYKTQNVYGNRIIDIPKELHEPLLTWSKINDSGYLIPNIATGNKMSQQGFTDLLWRIFSPKKVSTSMLRKIYISEILAEKEKTMAKEDFINFRKKLAHSMAHSLSTQEFVYSRFKN